MGRQKAAAVVNIVVADEKAFPQIPVEFGRIRRGASSFMLD